MSSTYRWRMSRSTLASTLLDRKTQETGHTGSMMAVFPTVKAKSLQPMKTIWILALQNSMPTLIPM